MYPNLRYALYHISGLDLSALSLIQTYGFLLALAFLSSGWALSADLRRREKKGLLQGVDQQVEVGKPLSVIDVLINAILGFALGFKGIYAMANSNLFTGADAQANFMSMEHGYWWAGLLLAGLFGWFKYREKQQELQEYPEPQVITKTIMPHERVSDIVIIAAVSGIIGAKLLYMTEVEYTSWEAMVRDFFSGSGLAVYGGFLLAFFVVSFYIWRVKIPFNQMIDACAPAMILAYGVGRLGCHFSGDGDWGDPNRYDKPFSLLPDWLWAYRYPNNVINEGVPMDDCYYPDTFGDYCHVLPEGVFPTPVFEFIMAFVIFLILWRLRHSIQAHGLLFFVYLIFNGLERYLIEIIRINDDYTVAGLTLSQAQYIAIGIFAVGVAGTIVMYLKQRQLIQAAATDTEEEDAP